MTNLKLAFRTLFKTPFVTAVAIISLAFGIGANTAIFSLFDQLLRRPLPVQAPTELANLSAPGPKPGSTSCNDAGPCDDVFSYPMFKDLEKARGPFAGLAAHRAFGANIGFHGQTASARGMMVSGSYFDVLGLRPAAGRLLNPTDDDVVGGEFVAVLSYSYWDTKLGRDPRVIGETISVNGQPMTIVGVAPQGFSGTTLPGQPALFVPISMRGFMDPGFKGFENRRSYWAYVFGRLKPGMTLPAAQSAINAVYQPIIREVETPLQEGMSEQTLARFKAREISLTDGQRGQSSMHKNARTPILMLFAITGLVLLIACANIANLLLARAANRSTEMAVRLSLGASRRQVLTQLLTESVLLAALGGIASLIVAHWTLAFIISLLPSDGDNPLVFAINPAVIGFAAALSIGTGLLFGLFPALQSTKPDLIGVLRSGSGKTSSARAAARFRATLVTAQIALSMALLASAGLFVKSLRNVVRTDLGIQTDNVVTFGISPELNAYTPAQSQAFFNRVTEQLAALPGVTTVSSGLVPILSNSNWGTDVSVQGVKRGPDTDANVRYNEVGPHYFATLGIPLLAGRDFTTGDLLGRPQVAIVNEAFIRKFALGRDVVGKLMGSGRSSDSLNIHIIGVVKDAKYSEVKGEIPPLFFAPWAQDSTLGQITFYVRTSQTPEPLLRAIPGVVKALDPNLPVENLKTLPQQVRENVSVDRLVSTLSASFAFLATLLAAVGLYGMLAYSVAQRTKEIGVRMALGADRARVQRLILRQVAVMTLIGGIIGLAAAFGLGKAASSLLYEMKGNDPVVFLSAATLLTLVALGAGFVPALRASRIHPMEALRYE